GPSCDQETVKRNRNIRNATGFLMRGIFGRIKIIKSNYRDRILADLNYSLSHDKRTIGIRSSGVTHS
ncbi:MAG: hypothetical protein U9R60_13030, partial [Bacteroidota bacterium]|nr:hypothetical protein [Bacteroidota bacterium]